MGLLFKIPIHTLPPCISNLSTMAPIKVICAGYGRSGTVSLRLALNTLGYLP
jgi:hypothetical protein